MSVRKDLLVGRWMHSHEEDAPGRQAYRPATFHFPPSRGRAGFHLHADGSLTEIGIGANDTPDERAGRWTVDGDTLVLEPAGEPERRLPIVALAADKLITQR